LSYPIAGLATGSVTPYIGLYGDYYFSLDTGAALTPGAIPFLVVDGWSARAIGGLSARFGAGAQAELGVERGGLGGNFAAWTYRARVSVPFQAQ
jgi:hypothetical protein